MNIILDKNGKLTVNESPLQGEGNNLEDLAAFVSDPSDGDTLVYDATAGIWKAGQGGGGGTVTDVQINGTSILNNGVANIPFGTDNSLGVLKGKSSYGTLIDDETGEIAIASCGPYGDDGCQKGTNRYRPVTPYCVAGAAFYGLAQAAGDATMKTAPNGTYPVGTYTAEAKAAIKTMLGVDLPAVNSDDNGKILKVVNGAWAAVTP